MKQDNLKSYRDEKVKKNTELVKRSIAHIKEYGGNISLSNISKVSYDIANDNENGLSVPALSKNKLYKNLIEQAKNEVENKIPASKTELSSKVLKEMSQAELIAEIYKLRVSMMEGKNELDILKDVMSEHNIEHPDDTNHSVDDNKGCMLALEHAINTLLKEQILYIDKNTFDVKLAALGTFVLKGSIFKKLNIAKAKPNEGSNP